jgi:hypothetical protein
MIDDAKRRHGRNRLQRTQSAGYLLNNRRQCCGRLCISMRDVFNGVSFGSRNESMAHDILPYLGHAKVLAKLSARISGKERSIATPITQILTRNTASDCPLIFRKLRSTFFLE